MKDGVCLFPISIVLSAGYGEAKRYPIDIMPFKTILELKEIVQNTIEIPKEKLKLFFNEKELDDDSSLTYYDIKDGSVVYISKKSDKRMTIFIQREYPRKETVAMVRVKASLTILELKHKIAKKRGFPIEEQNLFYRGTRLEANASTTLNDYRIWEGDFVILRLNDEPMKIKLEPYGKFHVLPKYIRAKPDTKIKTLKTAIEKLSEICFDDQTLLFQGTELENGSSFDDYGIKDGMTITVKFMFEIGVYDSKSQEALHFKVGPDTKVSEVMATTALKLGRQLTGHRLTHNCEKIDPDQIVERLELGQDWDFCLIEERS